jgi:metabolite-proton symporter
MLGTSIEWFDFFLYGTAAALVFNKIFFPKLDPLTGTLAAFATYAVGFAGRPLGGLIFGHFGDRIGRKSTLLITLSLMGIPTVLIGLLPSYAVLGYWATLLLVILRLIQGIAVGGEWGGAVLMAVEHAPAHQRGFFGSLPQTGVGAGLILSSIAMSLVTRLPEPAVLAWGWRIPFLCSIALLALGWFIRRQVPESPEFLEARAATTDHKIPALQVLRHHPRALLTIIGARVAENSWFYIVTTFALSYATTVLHLPRAQMLNTVTAGAALSILTMPAMGALSDRIGPRRLFAFGMLALCLAAWPFFTLLASKNPTLIWLAMVTAIGVIFAVLYAPESTLFAAQFPAEIRYSGISIAVQIAGAIGGGLAPVIATALLRAQSGNATGVALYMIALGLIALLCTALMRKAGAPPPSSQAWDPAGA